jgi:hypothetical protein
MQNYIFKTQDDGSVIGGLPIKHVIDNSIKDDIGLSRFENLVVPTGLVLYRRRFESAPQRGSLSKSVNGNLLEESSAQRIEFFNGVNSQTPKIFGGSPQIPKEYIQKGGMDENFDKLFDIIATTSNIRGGRTKKNREKCNKNTTKRC